MTAAAMVDQQSGTKADSCRVAPVTTLAEDESASASASESPQSEHSQARWLHYKPSGQSAKSISRRQKLYSNKLPAGDAGLDATRCNANKHKLTDDEPDFTSSTNAISSGGNNNAPLQSAPTNKHCLGPDQHHPDRGQHLSSQCDSSSLLVRFSAIMYATFLVILGTILHVSELRKTAKDSSDHIYSVIVALTGIGWLLFLQADLQRYKRQASKYMLIESIFNDRKHHQAGLNQSMDPSARSAASSSSSASLVNDRMSLNTEVIFKKTAYTMYQHRAALKRNRTHANPLNGSIISSSSSSNSLFNSPNQLKLGHHSFHHHQLDKHNHLLVPAYKFLHGKMGANFYLKCGMAAFCFGHIIHEGLRFGQQVYLFSIDDKSCRDTADMIAHLVTPLYSFYQLFMMFKYSNLVINRHKVLARFGLMHIVGTSITFWIRTILEEAYEDFAHKVKYLRDNNKTFGDIISLRTASSSPVLLPVVASSSSNERFEALLGGSHNSSQLAFALPGQVSDTISATIYPQLNSHLCTQNTLLTTKFKDALPYLYPFTIEYNLLLAATFLSLYFNIGKIGNPDGGGSHDNCRPPFSVAPPNGSLLRSSHSAIEGGSSKTVYSDHYSVHHGLPSNSNHTGEKETGHGEYKSNFVVNADCHSANKGLFCGFFVLLVTLVTIVIFFVTINKPTHVHLGIKINLIQEVTLTILILIVTLAGFKQVVKLNRNPYLKEKVTTDDVLMLIPLPFFFIHSLLSFRAETATMYSGSVPTFDPLTRSTGLMQPILISVRNNSVGNSSTNSIGVGSNVINARGGNRVMTSIDSRSGSNDLLPNLFNGTNNNRFDEELSSGIGSTRVSISNGLEAGRKVGGVGAGGGNINPPHLDHFKLITVALNIIVMIEVLVQTNFIIDGMRRCSESRYLRFKKPGRELITFAILLNITYWIVATFETKSVEKYRPEIEYYGTLPYMFISHTTLPVMLFYRYHSSVCLAEIWNRAYKPPKRR